VKRFLPYRDLLTTVAEIAGGACVVGGAFVLFGLGVSMIVLGVALIALGYLAGGE